MEIFLKNKYVRALILIVAVALVCSLLLRERPDEPSQNTQQTADEETKLSQILSQIDGAGEVEVMITYESGPEAVPAAGGMGEQLILKELSPVIRGVVIIAQGADDISVKMQLLQAAVTVLQVEETRIDVFTMRKD